MCRQRHQNDLEGLLGLTIYRIQMSMLADMEFFNLFYKETSQQAKLDSRERRPFPRLRYRMFGQELGQGYEEIGEKKEHMSILLKLDYYDCVSRSKGSIPTLLAVESSTNPLIHPSNT